MNSLRRTWAATAAGILALVGAVVGPARAAFAQVNEYENPSVVYAANAWDWKSYTGPNAGTVANGENQDDFQCAEFVSRALAAAGLIPGLNEYSPRTGAGSFAEYHAYGNTYNLLNVGSVAVHITWPIDMGIGYNRGLYDYLIDSGLGKDIGYNTNAAMPGDVVFWYGDNNPADGTHRHHAGLLIATGNPSETFYDAHNYARYWQPITSDRETKSIVRINKSYLSQSISNLETNTSACPGYEQYFSGTDVNGVPIWWTYAGGSHACVRVRYTTRVTTSSCTFKFFVPTGHATAVIYFGYWTTDGVKHYASIDEGPREGWYNIFSSANVTRIEFQDNNGQAYPLQIGWGRDYWHRLVQQC
jgi:hypothetical protein